MDQNIVRSETDLTAHQEIIGELERNRELLERIFSSTEKTRRYIFWLHTLSIIKIVLIVIPIIIGIIIVAPLLKGLKNILPLYTGGNIDEILDQNAATLENLKNL